MSDILYWLIGFLLRLISLIFDLADLFGFYLAFLHGFVLWKLHEINFIRSVVLLYVPEIFLFSRDRELDMWIERYVFFRRLQRHNTTTSFFNTLTFTHTHTHTHDWPTVAAGSSGSRNFFGFCKHFLTTCGQQEFFDRQGVT